MKKYTAAQKKIDYYQIEQDTIRYLVQKMRAQKKPLPDTVGGVKLEDVPLVLMNIRTYGPGKENNNGAGKKGSNGANGSTGADEMTGKDGKPQLQTVDTYIGEDGGDFKFVGRCDCRGPEGDCSAPEGDREPGTIFSYASHVSSISSYIGMYLEIFYNNSCMEGILGLSSQRDNSEYKVAETTLK